MKRNSQSDPTLLILASLAGGDKHGYAMMEDIQLVAAVRLGPGTLYGAITRLEERGWIARLAASGGDGDRRQPYTITRSGRKHLSQQLAALDHLVRIATARLEAV